MKNKIMYGFFIFFLHSLYAGEVDQFAFALEDLSPEVQVKKVIQELSSNDTTSADLIKKLDFTTQFILLTNKDFLNLLKNNKKSAQELLNNISTTKSFQNLIKNHKFFSLVIKYSDFFSSLLKDENDRIQKETEEKKNSNRAHKEYEHKNIFNKLQNLLSKDQKKFEAVIKNIKIAIVPNRNEVGLVLRRDIPLDSDIDINNLTTALKNNADFKDFFSKYSDSSLEKVKNLLFNPEFVSLFKASSNNSAKNAKIFNDPSVNRFIERIADNPKLVIEVIETNKSLSSDEIEAKLLLTLNKPKAVSDVLLLFFYKNLESELKNIFDDYKKKFVNTKVLDQMGKLTESANALKKKFEEDIKTILQNNVVVKSDQEKLLKIISDNIDYSDPITNLATRWSYIENSIKNGNIIKNFFDAIEKKTEYMSAWNNLDITQKDKIIFLDKKTSTLNEIVMNDFLRAVDNGTFNEFLIDNNLEKKTIAKKETKEEREAREKKELLNSFEKTDQDFYKLLSQNSLLQAILLSGRGEAVKLRDLLIKEKDFGDLFDEEIIERFVEKYKDNNTKFWECLGNMLDKYSNNNKFVKDMWPFNEESEC